MKNYIAIAALLAAGAAYVHAAADLTYIGDGKSDLLSYSKWYYFTNLEDNKVDGTWGTRPGDPEAGTKAFAFAGVANTSGTNADTDGSVYEALTTEGNTSYNLKFVGTADGSNDVSVSIGEAVYFNQVYTTDKVKSYTLNFGTEGSLTAATRYNNYGGAIQFTQGATVTMNVEVDAALLVAGDVYTRTLISSTDTTGNGLWNVTDNLTFNVSGLDGYESAGKVEDLNSLQAGQYGYQLVGGDAVKLVVCAAIPEPSAFGLLAGIGALALVASRRRRK